MHSKSFVACAAAAVLLAIAPAARAANFTDQRDSGNSVHQTELDEQYARSHSTIRPGTPSPVGRYGYGYVVPRHPKAKRSPSHNY